MHLVWAVKNRSAVLSGEFWSHAQFLADRSNHSELLRLIAIGGVAEHVHVLVRYRPDICIADIVHGLKGSLSHWVRREGGIPGFAWQKGYAAFSVSRSVVPKVVRYIEGQAEHHNNSPNARDS